MVPQEPPVKWDPLADLDTLGREEDKDHAVSQDLLEREDLSVQWDLLDPTDQEVQLVSLVSKEE